MTEKVKVIIDCDPGHDDAIALLLAIAHPMLDIKAITTVSGNAEIEKTTINALKVVEMAKAAHIPIAKGANQPIVGKIRTAAAIHGESGMDGPILPDPMTLPVQEHAVDVIIREVLNSQDDLVLIPTGPLTNIALALQREPQIISKIKEIVLMGGGTFGNWTPAAEFNIYVDAEAAKIVFESGVPITMIGLDLTHQVLATTEMAQRFMNIGNAVSTFVSELLSYFIQTYKEYFHMEGGPVHDVCAVAYVIAPSMFTTKKVRVDIETKGEFSYGMTVVDLLGVTGREPNVNFAESIDLAQFWILLEGALRTYSDKGVQIIGESDN